MTLKLGSVQIKQDCDENPDTSWIGEFTDTFSLDAMLWSTGEFLCDMPEGWEPPNRGRECRYFKPYAGGEKPDSKDWREYAKQDWEYMRKLERGDCGFVGITAVATVLNPCLGNPGSSRIHWIKSGGLWGVEAEYGKENAAYRKSVAEDEIANLRVELEAFGVGLENFDELAKKALEEME